MSPIIKATPDPLPENAVLEYEVFHPQLEPLVPPIICRSPEDAQTVLDQLLKLMTGDLEEPPELRTTWQVREVILNHRPIPPWAAKATAFTVEEGRRLAAQHGADILVIFSWALNRGANVVTVGKTETESNIAFNMSKQMLRSLGYDDAQSTLLEDRRHEHRDDAGPQVPGPDSGEAAQGPR